MPVYFIEQGEFVKIGRAEDVDARLAVHQGSSPIELKLLAVVRSDNDVVTERYLQGLFHDDHVRGEWYRASKRLRQFIEEESSVDIPEKQMKFIYYSNTNELFLPINTLVSPELLEWSKKARGFVDAIREKCQKAGKANEESGGV